MVLVKATAIRRAGCRQQASVKVRFQLLLTSRYNLLTYSYLRAVRVPPVILLHCLRAMVVRTRTPLHSQHPRRPASHAR